MRASRDKTSHSPLWSRSRNAGNGVRGHERVPAGGHAVLAVGYDDASQRFIVRNSWGSGWGMGGYCTMPYSYLTDQSLARDFWAVYAVENPA